MDKFIMAKWEDGIARSLINKPDMLVIDDPFLGLDPEATELVCASLMDC